jgi:hypothetical protein
MFTGAPKTDWRLIDFFFRHTDRVCLVSENEVGEIEGPTLHFTNQFFMGRRLDF